MPLRLSIENETRLPDGGPLSVTVSGKRGLDIGRDQHLDWTLPDPTRTISGKHCEIRFHDGAYWLHDVSTNGTFVNGSDRRMQAPHRLRNGDRIEIGHYIISVALDGEEAAAPANPPEAQQASSRDGLELWERGEGAAPPASRREFQPVRETRPVNVDPLDWLVDLPGSAEPVRPTPVRDQPRGQPGPDELAWASPRAPAPASPEPPTPVPTPRHPLASPGPANPWDDISPFTSEPPPSWAREAAPAPLPEPNPAPRPLPASPSLPPESATAAQEILARFARGAGIPEETVASWEAGDLAEHLGVLMRLVAEELKQLLAARAESKRIARSGDHTLVQAVDNNPLKFSPSVEDALRLMFGPPTPGYLDARRTLEQSFRDLKIHQVKTYAAMQHALRLLTEDLDPQAIEDATPPETGLGGLLTSRKARLWDSYATRWHAKTASHEDGLLGAFLLYFAECYDRSAQKPR